jgi:hypothetical protein
MDQPKLDFDPLADFLVTFHDWPKFKLKDKKKEKEEKEAFEKDLKKMRDD